MLVCMFESGNLPFSLCGSGNLPTHLHSLCGSGNLPFSLCGSGNLPTHLHSASVLPGSAPVLMLQAVMLVLFYSGLVTRSAALLPLPALLVYSVAAWAYARRVTPVAAGVGSLMVLVLFGLMPLVTEIPGALVDVPEFPPIVPVSLRCRTILTTGLLVARRIALSPVLRVAPSTLSAPILLLSTTATTLSRLTSKLRELRAAIMLP